MIVPVIREVPAPTGDDALRRVCAQLREQGWTGIHEGAELFDVTADRQQPVGGPRRYAVIVAALREIDGDGPPDVDAVRAELTGLGWTPLPDGHEVHDLTPTDDHAGGADHVG